MLCVLHPLVIQYGWLMAVGWVCNSLLASWQHTSTSNGGAVGEGVCRETAEKPSPTLPGKGYREDFLNEVNSTDLIVPIWRYSSSHKTWLQSCFLAFNPCNCLGKEAEGNPTLRVMSYTKSAALAPLK